MKKFNLIFLFIFLFLNFFLYSCKSFNDPKYVKVDNVFENEKIRIYLDILNYDQIYDEFRNIIDIVENPYINRYNTFSKDSIFYNVFKIKLISKVKEVKFKFLDSQVKDIENNFLGIFYSKEKILHKYREDNLDDSLINKYEKVFDKTYIDVNKTYSFSKGRENKFYYIIVSDRKIYQYNKDFKVLIKFILDDMPQSYVFYFKSEAPKEEEKKEESW